MKKLVLSLMVIFTTMLLFKTYASFYLADLYYVKSRSFLKQSEIEKSLEYAKKAILRNPREPNYYRGMAKALITSEVFGEVSASTKESSLYYLSSALELNPENLVTLRNLVPLYYFLSIKDLSAPAAKDNIDPTYLDVTRRYYQTVFDYSPNDVGIYVLLAKYSKKLELTELYENSIEKIEMLRPDLLEWCEDLL
jgi:tetratricopeptide (TPR) repeat protein